MATQTLVMDAVEQLGLRVTLGDIASSTGLALHEAKQELLNLAQKAEGHLQVSRQGEITYVFPPDFRSILKRKEQQDQLAALRRKLWGGLPLWAAHLLWHSAGGVNCLDRPGVDCLADGQ